MRYTPLPDLTKNRQSKLSQEQLTQLQKDTHFDKKELQQWYKGECFCPRLNGMCHQT